MYKPSFSSRLLPWLTVTMAFWPFTETVSADQPLIRYLPEQKLWVLETARSSYVLGLSRNNELRNLYWGGKLSRDQDLSQDLSQEAYAFESPEGFATDEYPGWGACDITSHA